MYTLAREALVKHITAMMSQWSPEDDDEDMAFASAVVKHAGFSNPHDQIHGPKVGAWERPPPPKILNACTVWAVFPEGFSGWPPGSLFSNIY